MGEFGPGQEQREINDAEKNEFMQRVFNGSLERLDNKPFEDISSIQEEKQEFAKFLQSLHIRPDSQASLEEVI